MTNTTNAVRPDHSDNTTDLADALCIAGTGTYPVARALRDAATYYRTMHDVEATTPGSTDHDVSVWHHMATDADYAAYRVDASADLWYDNRGLHGMARGAHRTGVTA